MSEITKIFLIQEFIKRQERSSVVNRKNKKIIDKNGRIINNVLGGKPQVNYSGTDSENKINVL